MLGLQKVDQVLRLQLEQLDLGEWPRREDDAAVAQGAIASLHQTVAAVQAPARMSVSMANGTATPFARTYRHSMHDFLRRNTVNWTWHDSQGMMWRWWWWSTRWGQFRGSVRIDYESGSPPSPRARFCVRVRGLGACDDFAQPCVSVCV